MVLSESWRLLVLGHLAATATMVGILLTVHFVHYPLFDRIDPSLYRDFQERHMRSISQVLAAPWLVEGVTAAALVVVAPTTTLRLLALVGAAGVLVTVAITGALAAPAHGRLLDGFDPDLHRRLLRVDGWRTAVWGLRGVVALALAVETFVP